MLHASRVMKRSRSTGSLLPRLGEMEARRPDSAWGGPVPQPIFASTPGINPLAKPGTGPVFKDVYSRLSDQTEMGRVVVDMTDLRVQHLTELLEGERRAVRLLSHFSNINLGKVDSVYMDLENSEPKGKSSYEMPVLETMVTKQGVEMGSPAPCEASRVEVTAQDVYNQSWNFEKLLTPEKSASGTGSTPDGRIALPTSSELVCVNGSNDTTDVRPRPVESRTAGRRAPRMKPTSYDGQTPYEDYQVQFCMLAELNGWDHNEKALYLAGCLQGSARSVLNDMAASDRYSYVKLDEALRERFGTDDQSELFKSRLRNRVKTKDETLQELAHDIRRLVRLAYPGAAIRTHEDLTKDQFIEALGDGEVRWSVFQTRPRTLTEALKVAMELEAFKESEKCRMRKNIRGVTIGPGMGSDIHDASGVDQGENPGMGYPVTQRFVSPAARRPAGGPPGDGGVGHDREPAQGNNQVRASMGALDAGPRVAERAPAAIRAPFDISRIRCFRCDKLGHYARDCPELPRRGPIVGRKEEPLNEKALDH
jgi:hypothetical protein